MPRKEISYEDLVDAWQQHRLGINSMFSGYPEDVKQKLEELHEKVVNGKSITSDDIPF